MHLSTCLCVNAARVHLYLRKITGDLISSCLTAAHFNLLNKLISRVSHAAALHVDAV